MENNPNTANQQLLSPAAIALIEKLAQSGLLINKLTINNQQLLHLSLGGNSQLSGIQLPGTVASIIADNTRQPAQVKIAIVDNQVRLTFEPLNPKSGSFPPGHTSEITFKQAQLVAAGLLKFRQPVNLPAQPANTPAQSQFKAEVTTTMPLLTNLDSNNSSKAGSQQAMPLNQVVAHFLKSKPVQSENLSLKLSGLLQNFNKLVESTHSNLLTDQSLNQKLLQSPAKLITNFIRSNTPTDVNASRLDLLIKIQAAMGKLNQLTGSPASLDKTSIQKLVQNSGIFNEAGLKGAGSTESSPGKLNSDTVNNNIKLTGQHIKQSLELLLNNLNKAGQSLHVPKLLTELVKNAQSAENQMTGSQTTANRTDTNQATNKPGATFSNTSTETTAQKSTEPGKSSVIMTNSPLKQQLNSIISESQWSRLNLSSQQLTHKQDLVLANQQKQILTEMLTEINQVLNRIETNQLLSLKTDNPGVQQYLLDLPLLHNGNLESFELLFTSNEQSEDKKSSKVWSVTIKFDLEPLGPMFARVSFKNQRISTRFFAEEQTTARLLSENIHHLKDSLFIAGLDTDEIEASQGIVPSTLKENVDNRLDIRV